MKPILFSTSMVKAILAGNKTQTRRIMNPQPVKVGSFWRYDKYSSGTTDPTKMDCMPLDIRCKYGQVGDVLWIKEMHYAYGMWLKNGHTKSGRQKWRFFDTTLTGYQYHYADNPPENILPNSKRETYGWFKRSSLFMPFKASRLFLKITNIEVEILQDISEQDAIAEGCKFYRKHIISGPLVDPNIGYMKPVYPITQYRELWNKINGKGSWDSNPFVWKITFQKIDKPNNL